MRRLEAPARNTAGAVDSGQTAKDELLAEEDKASERDKILVRDNASTKYDILARDGMSDGLKTDIDGGLQAGSGDGPGSEIGGESENTSASENENGRESAGDDGDDGDDEVYTSNSDYIKKTIEAFTALPNRPDGETDRAGAGSFGAAGTSAAASPRSSRDYPFAASRRPERTKTDIKAHLRSLKSDKGALVSLGPALVLAFLIFSMVFAQTKLPIQMYVNGTPIALVSSKEAGRALLERASLELSSPYPAEANFRQKATITYSKDGVPLKSRPTNPDVVVESLKNNITWLVDGWTIAVNNERTVFLPSRADAEAVLNEVKRLYLPESDQVTVLATEFVQPVELLQQEIPVSSLGSGEQALKTLTEGKEVIREYEVQRGDSLWAIANRYGLTVNTLKEINALINDNLRPGQILRLNSPQPLLSVKMTVSAISQEEIPYETVYKPNDAAWEGQSKVLSAGTRGAREITYQMDQINGVLVNQVVLAETVIAEPVDRVVENGTKIILASRGDGEGGGALAWPIRGAINSPFGPRSRGFHSGIDIQADTGDPVYSAKEGKVVQASYSGGYGNCVTIDHGDGLATMYAHLSQMNVAVGQEVGRQELVGLAGTTGRTTGPHLHFEVRVNGSPNNPVLYLE
ncbi:MAG: peptidoglycan DD-metalloendopeptidase family protein [Peptococcaceae bacterium]|nr:peptidoglycan DD-metalloendopeptidase family protein [Peptococcaceae bacterium]